MSVAMMTTMSEETIPEGPVEYIHEQAYRRDSLEGLWVEVSE
jgi:hypothetical protein